MKPILQLTNQNMKSINIFISEMARRIKKYERNQGLKFVFKLNTSALEVST
jgi:hypothetical protein